MILYLSFVTEEEKDKFTYIYEKYKRLLLYKAREILKDQHLAEDSTNEAFIRIYKNLHKIDDLDSNQTISFLVTIVKNTSLTLLSKNKKNTTYELFEDEEVDDFDTEDYILTKLQVEQIYTIIDKLSEDLKSVFILKYSQDLSHKEIGDILGITENNVTVRIHRARKKLSNLLREKEGKDNER